MIIINGKKRKLFYYFIISMLILSVIPSMAFATVLSDIDNHWAKDQIIDWVNKDLINGYEDGTFKPDAKISRAEFMSLVNRAFGYSEKAAIDFKDVPADAWFADDVSKAKAAGYIDGYSDGTIKPDNFISRQEVAVIIMKITGIVPDLTATEKFHDSADIAVWSKGSIGAVVDANIMGGYPDGTFKAEGLITRAEAVVALNRALNSRRVSITYDKAGVYGPAKGVQAVEGDVTVSADGVILQNMNIKGKLILAKSIGEGEVTLKNVTVNGDTEISGGGENSIIVIDSNLGHVKVFKENGKIRIVVSGSTRVSEVIANSGLKLEEKDLIGIGFEEVVIDAEEKDTIILAGSFETVEVKAEGTTIDIPQGTVVNTLTLDKKATISGKGTIQTAKVNVSGVVFETAPKQIETAPNISPPTVTGSTSNSSGGGSSGGSSDGGNTTPAVNHKPEGSNQTANGTVGMKFTFDLSTMFTDVDNDPMTYAVVSDNGAAEAVLNADGKTVEYTPISGDAGKNVVTTVKANDGKEDSNHVTITLTVAVLLSNDAALSDLKVNGTTVPGFAKDRYSYSVELPTGITDVPTVVATVNTAGKATAVVTNAASLPGATTVVVTAEDGITTQTYTINFTVAAIVPSAGLDNWTVRLSNTKYTLCDVAYGNGIFVAVGQEDVQGNKDLILTSSDGKQWTKVSEHLYKPLYSITYVDDYNAFFAVGDEGTVLTSTNGIEWTKMDFANVTNMGSPLFSIAYGKNTLVASSDYVAFYSAYNNGWSWDFDKRKLLENSDSIFALAYGDGKFVAMGNNNIYTSPDGVQDWVKYEVFPGTYWKASSIAFNGSKFVAAGTIIGQNYYKSAILTSENGNDWALDELELPEVHSEGLNGITWGGNYFVAVGENEQILSSLDGETWTVRRSNKPDRLYAVAYGKDSFVAIGQSTILQSDPISTAPLSNNATLSDLKVNGTTVTGFAHDVEAYNIELPVGTTDVPTVAATVTDNGKATAVVNKAASLPGVTTVVVTAEDGTKLTYIINFTVEAPVKNISSADNVAKTVSNGTDIIAARAALGAEVTVNLEGGGTAQVPITWSADSTPTYDGNTARDYVFTGTFGTMPEGIANGNNVAAPTGTVTVNVADTSAEDNADIEKAKNTLSTAATLNTIEGKDTNVVTMAQKLVDEVVSGVVVSVDTSQNIQIGTDGTITYADQGITGNVVFALNKGMGTEDTVTMSVVVPQKLSYMDPNSRIESPIDGSLYGNEFFKDQAQGGTAPYTFTLVEGSLPAGINLTPDGILSGTPEEAVAPISFKVRITDSNSATAENQFTIAVRVATPKPSPNNSRVKMGTKVTLSTATAGANIYYKIDGDGSWPTASDTPYVSGNLIEINKNMELRAIAIKPDLPAVCNSGVSHISYIVNNKPVGTNQTVNGTVDTLYSLDLSSIFIDADGDKMTYVVVSDNGAADAALNADGKTVEYIPVGNDAGKDVIITVKAWDGLEYSDDVTITITVAVPNQAPTVKAGQGTQTGAAVPASNDGSIAAVKYTADASAWFEDVNTGDTLACILVSAAEGANDVSANVSINGNTLEYTPAAAQASKAVTIEIKANDGTADSTSNVTVTVNVGAVPDTTPPVLSDVTAGTIKISSNVSATSNEDGFLYLVPEGTIRDKDIIDAAGQVANGKKAASIANVPANLNTFGFVAGNYVVYAIDMAGNVSQPSGVIAVKPQLPKPTSNEVRPKVLSGYKVNLYTVVGATIHYTVNGSDPTTSSPVYNLLNDYIIIGNVGDVVIVKAIAVSDNGDSIDSSVATFTYTIAQINNAQVSNSKRVIVYGVGSFMNGSGDPNAFKVTGSKTANHTVSGVSTSGNMLYIDLDSDIQSGETITLTYTKTGENNIKMSDGTEVVNFSDFPVLNQLP